MTNKIQKIREGIEKLKSNLIHGACSSQVAMETRCKEEAYNEVLAILDTMQEESVSEDFEKALASEWKAYNDRGAATVDALEDNTQELAFAKGFYRGANWQREQDQSTIELAEDHAMLAGMEKMKEEMMANATEVTVHIEAGNYPYIPQLELYDYDKDMPLAKEGDKYKVILIKED